MFQEALDAVAPGLDDGAVTLVISNKALRSRLRGYSEAGRRAVGTVGDLLENPTQTVQEHPSLYVAATTVAKRLHPLVPFVPKLYRGSRRKPVVLGLTYLDALKAIGYAMKPDAGFASIAGETVIYSPILRFGRAKENSPNTIRIRFNTSFHDVEVEPNLASVCAELTVSRKIVPIRLRGHWVEGTDGLLELRDAVAFSIDCTFELWSGDDLVQDVRDHTDLFDAESFKAMRQSLEDIRGD